MRKYLLIASSIAATLIVAEAKANQWDDLISNPVTTPILNGKPTGFPATNITLDAVSFSCPDPSEVAAIAGFQGQAQRCGERGGRGVSIDLAQFARQSDLSALQNQVNAFIASNQFEKSLHAISKGADQGVAMSFAMAGVADLQSDEHFAVSANWGTYNGQNGAAFGAAYRLSDHASINGGVVVPVEGGSVGGRAGVRFGW